MWFIVSMLLVLAIIPLVQQIRARDEMIEELNTTIADQEYQIRNLKKIEIAHADGVDASQGKTEFQGKVETGGGDIVGGSKRSGDVNINVNNENPNGVKKMTEENKGGGINFGGNVDTGGGDVFSGDKVAGDKVAGDKVTGGQVKAETIEGGVVQTNTVNMGDTMPQEIVDYFDAMTAAAKEAGAPDWEAPVEPRAIPTAETEEAPVDKPVFTDFESLEIPEYTENEDHPQAVFAAANAYASAPTPPPVEEQKSFYQKAMSCVKKYATSDEAVALGKMALAGMEATASIAPPFNVIAAAVKTGIALTGK